MAKPSRNTNPKDIETDRRTFFISYYVKAKKFVVNDFVVMPDHIHLIITLDKTITVERAAQLVKGNFSYRAKKDLKFQREIWQPGFSDERIWDRESFLKHRKYIDENPVKAGLAKTAEEYPYCSAYFRKKRNSG